MLTMTLNDLMEYSAWERNEWRHWLLQHGDQVLETSAGAHGDGRFQTVGDLILHIFSAEKRYVERLSGQPLTDPSTLPSKNVEALFQFGDRSREGLRNFLESYPAANWDVPQELKFPNSSTALKVTPRKIVTHVVLHEIRHWAQIATLLRLNGMTDDFHDFLFCPVMGGEFKREGANA